MNDKNLNLTTGNLSTVQTNVQYIGGQEPE